MDIAGELRYLAAQFRGRPLRPADLRPLIDQMMYQDIWYEEFAYVLDADPRHLDDVAPVLVKALGHYGLGLPDEDEAPRVLIRRLLRPIVEGAIDPIDGLLAFMAGFYWSSPEEFQDENLLGESFGIELLVSSYFRLDDWLGYRPNLLSDPQHAQDVAELKAEIVARARAWLDRFPDSFL